MEQDSNLALLWQAAVGRSSDLRMALTKVYGTSAVSIEFVLAHTPKPAARTSQKTLHDRNQGQLTERLILASSCSSFAHLLLTAYQDFERNTDANARQRLVDLSGERAVSDLNLNSTDRSNTVPLQPVYGEEKKLDAHCEFPPHHASWDQPGPKFDAKWSIMRSSGCFTKSPQGRISKTNTYGQWVTAPVTCSFFVNEQGNPTMTRVKSSSGNLQTDQIALNLIRKGAPYSFPPRTRIYTYFTESNLTICLSSGSGDEK